MKHIGILACSAEGAALCYRTLCLEAEKLLNLSEHYHPEVSLHNHCLGDYMEHLAEKNDWQGVAQLMQSSYDKLVEIGAEIVVCPDNTIHQAYPQVKQKSRVKWLHIAQVVADEAIERGYKKLAVLGTKFLMEGPVYPEALQKKGIDYAIPSEPERQEINRSIFEELVLGQFNEESRSYFSGVIERLKIDDGCDAAVLGCTEIPLLVSDKDSSLPILDSTRLLARAALKESCLVHS